MINFVLQWSAHARIVALIPADEKLKLNSLLVIVNLPTRRMFFINCRYYPSNLEQSIVYKICPKYMSPRASYPLFLENGMARSKKPLNCGQVKSLCQSEFAWQDFTRMLDENGILCVRVHLRSGWVFQIWPLIKSIPFLLIQKSVKFIYSEKATKFCEISTVDLTGTT